MVLVGCKTAANAAHARNEDHKEGSNTPPIASYIEPFGLEEEAEVLSLDPPIIYIASKEDYLLTLKGGGGPISHRR